MDLRDSGLGPRARKMIPRFTMCEDLEQIQLRPLILHYYTWGM